MIDILDKIFQQVLQVEDIPSDWAKMLVTPIYKKGDRHNTSNYRAVALLSISGKVFNSIILETIREKTEQFSSDRQFGFRQNRGTVDAIFLVRLIMEKAKERNVKVHFHFIDYKAAFDAMWRKTLWKMLRAIGVPTKIVNIIEKIYNNTKCTVVVNGHITEWFEVLVGVRQGCILSPTLFNLFLDFLMKELSSLQDTICLDENLNVDVRYADDTTLIAAIFSKLKLSTEQLVDACNKYGLKINAPKCKLITEEETEEIEIEQNSVDKVNNFIFLGSSVPGTSSDIERRLALACNAFGRLKTKIFSSRSVLIKLKVRLYYALTVPIAIYASCTWAPTKRDEQRLQVFENNCLRTMLNIRLKDKVSITNLRKRAGIKNTILNIIKMQRLTWFGHVCRLDNTSAIKQVLKAEFKNKRPRGRPKK